MLNSGFILLAIVAVVAWFWFDNARAKEKASMLGLNICRHHNLQFLEDTAVLRSTRLLRIPGGIGVRREFDFEYTEEGVSRHKGSIILIGIRIHRFSLEEGHLPLPESTQPDQRVSNVIPFKPRQRS
ncbi:MAG: hypothetical protein A2286_06750 [Gammaproteobacteria bacterium RIFOXYA12_FULL_61_12]|nr:MAG: hypothetical protein A2286_06750 [Gammaproteobacteria bacterium RIFOXYA12_FULL_61_12]OGT90054.1 MAG: hypothetical protein A2514_09085 [Gammaproteobacteria bacterium RIFOXYD12_FULL_61_37]